MSDPTRAEQEMILDCGVSQPADEEIAALAYHLWAERGCPIGSPDDDWFRAEAELKSKTKVLAATA